jgi:hypothetical protein
MKNKHIWIYIALFMFITLDFAANVQSNANELIFRLGQGGFNDERSPGGSLGGGQICLDIKFNKLPIAVSIGQEYYTNGPEPTQHYEISKLVISSLYYVKPLMQKWPMNIYLGGGIGKLNIPQGDEAIAFQGIARINTKIFWKIGFYMESKYIYSKKDLIDFNEFAFLVGIYLKLKPH